MSTFQAIGGVGYVGAALGNAMRTAVPHIRGLGYDDKDFLNLVMEHLGGMGIERPAPAVKGGVEVAHASAPSHQGRVQDSGVASYLA